MAWWLYKLTKPFRDFKWRLKMWIQWHYFFMWKKTYEMWYDEDSHKWKKSKCYNLAKYDSYDWYNGIWSILKAMDMKTFWIWFKLRQDGNHAKSYIHAADFLNHAAEKDISDLYRGPPGPIFPILCSIFASFLRFIQAYVRPAFILILAFPFIWVYRKPCASFAVPNSRSIVSFR